MRTADGSYERSACKTPWLLSGYPRSVPKSRFFPNSEQAPILHPIVPLGPLDQRPHQPPRRRSLERALPKVLGHLLVQGQCLRGRGDHRHADADIGLLAEPERTERQHLAVRLAKKLKARVRQGVWHDADLHSDRLVLHERDEMLGLCARQRAPFAPYLFRQAEAADQAVFQKVLHLDRRDEIDDAGLAPAVGVLALAQHRDDLIHLIERALAARQRGGEALPQNLAK